MQYTLDDTENDEITQAVLAAYSHLGPQPQALNRALLWSRHDRDWPMWMALCHAVIVRGRFHQHGSLPALVQQLGDEAGLQFEPALDPQLQDLGQPGSQPALSPARVAGLAAGLAHPGSPSALQPACLQDDLVLRLFEGQWPPAAGKLNLTQMLVSAWQGAHDSGRVARLELWLLPADSLQRPGDHGALVRAPGAALLPVDPDFAEGLDRVQRQLRQVLQPGAPAVAWNLRPLPLTDLPDPPPLPGISGHSATAALAYGALYLLRLHLQPAHAALADSLLDTAPANIAITAGLDGPLGGAEAGNTPWHWPRLVRVGGLDYKLGALQRTLPPRQAAWRYVAHDQHASAQALAAAKPLGLDDLIVGISQDCGGGLDADARQLHRLLIQDDAPITDPALLARVANSRARPASVKAYLLWRYARRASGSHQAFGDPVRLDQHYIRLVLKAPGPEGDEPGDPDDTDPSGPDSRAEDEVFTLDHLLGTPPHDQAPAWCVESAPFTGKTTLLAAHETGTARRALQRHHRQAGWGEVCVFLPMRAFKPPPLPALASPSQQAAVLDAFVSFVDTHAPGLPPLPQLLAGGGNAPGLQCRLLVDGLNELPAASLDERRAVMALICTWMHRHQQHLLPPVFSVRELENGLDLASDDDRTWRARRALLQPWRRSDWAAYIALRQLPPQAHQRLHTALRLHLPDAHGHADDTPFEQFCRSPGILAAQCTLLRLWPGLQPPERQAQLFLALLWHCLAERGASCLNRCCPRPCAAKPLCRPPAARAGACRQTPAP